MCNVISISREGAHQLVCENHYKTMGLNKFVSLFADAVLSPDCNHQDRHEHDSQSQTLREQHQQQHKHKHNVTAAAVAGAATIVVRPDGRIVAASAMYNSELDIYGTAALQKIAAVGFVAEAKEVER